MLLLHRYRPFSVDALGMLAIADLQERQVQTYSADMTWMLLRCVGAFLGGSTDGIESPSNFARGMNDKKPKDNRTTQEITNDILARLRE